MTPVMMLHGNWTLGVGSEGQNGAAAVPAGLILWGEIPAGEDDSLPAAPPPEPQGSAPAQRYHPFAASAVQLRQAVPALHGARDLTAIVYLPSRDEGPQASPGLAPEGGAVSAGQSTSLSLLPWAVPALWLPPPRVLSFLAGLTPGSSAWNGTALQTAPDLAWWQQLGRWVTQLMARQHVIPGFRPLTTRAPQPPSRAPRRTVHGEARWLPLPDEAETEAFASLVAAMPPAALCLKELDGTDAALHPQERPEAAWDFACRTLDAAARTWLETTTPPVTVSRSVGRWFRALYRPAGEAAFTLPAGDELDLTGWLEMTGTAGRERLQTSFRLLAPEPDPARGNSDGTAGAEAGAHDEPWRLEAVLRLRGGTAQLPATHLLAAGSGPGSGAGLAGARRRILVDLAEAADWVPITARLRQGNRPGTCLLTAAEAARFLAEGVPALRRAGFEVVVPSWWMQAGSRLTLSLRVRPDGSPTSWADGAGRFGLFTARNIFQFDWQLALDGEPLTEGEFQRLVASQQELVRVRGRWVRLDAARLAQARRFMERHSAEELGMAELLRYQLEAEEADTGLAVQVDAAGSAGQLLERLLENDPSEMEEIDPPTAVRAHLRPYQLRGFHWLAFMRRWGLGSCLADDMGLGKTLQVLTLLAYDKEHGAEGPVLVVCPTSVVETWRREAERFTPSLDVHIHHGGDRLTGPDLAGAAGAHDVVITTYTLARMDETDLDEVPWRGIVLDEAQNIKNPATQQSQSVRRLGQGFRIALTGTPLENRLRDLWSIMQFLNPGYLGSWESFRRRFVVSIEREGDAKASQQLRRLVQPFILRRVKTDPRIMPDLPEKQINKVYCRLTAEQAALYQATLDEMLVQIEASDDIQRRGLVLKTLTRLKQICNHPEHLLREGGDLEGRSGKLNRLQELLDEVLAGGDQALIFTQYVVMGRLLARWLADTFSVTPLFLHGGVTREERVQLVRRFQDERETPVLILSLRAGGTGLNLTAANHIFHYDRWWNPAVERQATDRAFRIGQEQRVLVHKFITQGTVEERIDELMERKQVLADEIVGAGQRWLTELDTDELRELLVLRQSVLDGRSRS